MLPNKKTKNIFLLVVSYIFYGYWDWRFCLLLTTTTLIDYFVGRQLFTTTNDVKRKRLLIFSLIVNLSILGFFKYFNFFVESFEDMCSVFGGSVDFLHLNIILPVGLSFYTFHNISYIVDVYNKKIEPTDNIVDFGLFVVFFPQLVAGPLGRATTLLPQISRDLKPTSLQIQQGIVLIISGLFRKVMIGDTTGRFVDYIFSDLGNYKSFEILCGLVLFTIQIYADFSGYSHVARGTSKLFGVELMKNFEQPYLSRNITEFWSRWHISLSTWLRDYLYIPLGGNKKGKVRTYFNLFLTMVLGGLWHGASWNFVIYGGLHGIYLSIHKIILGKKHVVREKIQKINFATIIGILFTFILVIFSRIFFRSTSWDSTQLIFSKLIHWESSENAAWFIYTTLTYLVILFALDIMEYTTGKHAFLMEVKSKPFRFGILAGLFVFTLFFMFQIKTTPFVYFKF